MSFALVTTLSLLPLLCAILVCTLITIWTWTLKYPTSSVHVHIICATSTTSAGIFPQQQRNVSSTPWLRLDLTIATLFSITLPPTIYRVFNGCTTRQRGLFCVVPEQTEPHHFYANCIGYQSRVGFSTRCYSSATRITHRHAQFYLRDLLPSYQPTRCLRSSSSNALVVPRTRGKAGDAAFSVAAPRLLNALPHKLKCVANINILKNHLKTHLFTF